LFKEGLWFTSCTATSPFVESAFEDKTYYWLRKHYYSVSDSKDLKTGTTDNGTKFCNRKAIAMGLDTTVYFTDPYSSWQKGAIENANGLIRQYIPKSTPIKHLKDSDIDEITTKINTRPRKKLNFSTPMEEFFNYLL
jgi:IS30 family transposase